MDSDTYFYGEFEIDFDDQSVGSDADAGDAEARIAESLYQQALDVCLGAALRRPELTKSSTCARNSRSNSRGIG